MRILVCGGRDFSNYVLLYDALDELQDRLGPFSVIIAGRHPGDPKAGADYWAEAWSFPRRIPFYGFPVNWGDISHPDALVRLRRDGTQYDAKAGPRRNARMLAEGKPDLCVAFPRANGRWGSGTLDMMQRAKAAGLDPIKVAGWPFDIPAALTPQIDPDRPPVCGTGRG